MKAHESTDTKAYRNDWQLFSEKNGYSSVAKDVSLKFFFMETYLSSQGDRA